MLKRVLAVKDWDVARWNAFIVSLYRAQRVSACISAMRSLRPLNPYRIIFLYPRYQQSVSASNLLGVLLGLFLFAQLAFELAARLEISSSMPVWQAANGGFWLACTGIALPLLFYGSVVAMACLSGVAMWWVGWLQPHEFWDYATQRRFPASWFEHTPTF